jgi:hypothetical protein
MPGRDFMKTHELGHATDTAKVFFNNLALELAAELPALLHDKILSSHFGDLEPF